MPCYDLNVPIYEFYCADCNALLNFFSSRVDTEKRPDCPKCERKQLERRPARFATLRHGTHDDGTRGDDDAGFDGLDEPAFQQAMEGLAGELESLGDSEDPKRFAGVLRNMGASSDLEMGPRMEELLGRLESGADLDTLESEMTSEGENGDSGDEAFEDYFRLKKRLAAWRDKRPRVDKELYFF